MLTDDMNLWPEEAPRTSPQPAVCCAESRYGCGTTAVSCGGREHSSYYTTLRLKKFGSSAESVGEGEEWCFRRFESGSYVILFGDILAEVAHRRASLGGSNDFALMPRHE